MVHHKAIVKVNMFLYIPLFTKLQSMKEHLIVNRLPIRSHRRLLERLCQRRMRMTRPPHILARRAILDSQDPLRNHLARIRSHDMNPQYPIGLRVRHKLHHAVRLQVRLRPRIRGKGESADFVLDALLFELGFVLSDPCDFGVGVHD